MVNHSVNECYIRLLFKIDALPHDVPSPLDISATFFKKLSLKIREFLISEGVQVPLRPPTENNYQGNQRIILVSIAAVESEKKIRTIEASVKPASGSRYNKIFMGMPAGNP